ncbi:hypothetical protein L6J37_16590 [Photobacterium sp. WH77]|uniref:Uncharacterized protein n=1 Tax=Photobacterium arenosum TaxID=2774143 RepID=A0ABR9BFV2_9GAMM|nr:MULTISPECIES: hypothetical protein [Photobacterium]MBD8511332.1 hypothetical protein [Photobacterium arenosum]MCG2838451.1 hypothetical protein [Photobacterium sp. WH77]MCG2846068.1 hypothetical protein [Photobacterium sp. WH80]
MASTAQFTLSSCLIPIAVLVLFTMQLAMKSDDRTLSVSHQIEAKGFSDGIWQDMDSLSPNQ